MDRIEFNKKKTPIPFIAGTDYSRIINIRKSADLSGDNSGPYSSLFDYKQEEADLKAQNDKKQAVQQKIMRTNALGEAFRLLAEGVGASAGATITPRNVNPGILSAVNEYGKNDTEYMQRLQGINTKKLALKQADLQYSLGQDAAALDKAEKQAERTHQESIQAGKEVDTYIRELRLQESQFRLRGLEGDAEGVRKKIQMGEQAMLEIGIARKKEQFARGMDLMGQGETTGIDISTPPKPTDKETMQFVTPDTKKTIYINPGMINYIRTQLQTGKGKYDQSVPQVLRDAMVNKAIKPEALATVFTDQWDYIRDNVLPPDVFKQIYGAEPGQVASSSSQPIGDWQQLLLDDIENTFNDSSIKDMDQLFHARDEIIKKSQENGEKITANNAMLQAREMKKKWRQRQPK